MSQINTWLYTSRSSKKNKQYTTSQTENIKKRAGNRVIVNSQLEGVGQRLRGKNSSNKSCKRRIRKVKKKYFKQEVVWFPMLSKGKQDKDKELQVLAIWAWGYLNQPHVCCEYVKCGCAWWESRNSDSVLKGLTLYWLLRENTTSKICLKTNDASKSQSSLDAHIEHSRGQLFPGPSVWVSPSEGTVLRKTWLSLRQRMSAFVGRTCNHQSYFRWLGLIKIRP